MAVLFFLFAFQPPPLTYEQELAAMEADYARLPLEEKAHVRYLSAHALPNAIRAGDVAAFIMPHLTSQQLLEYCIPSQVTGTRFYRIELVSLRWTKGWPAVVKHYPYDPSGDPLIVRLDWLLAQTANRKSEAYYDLLYGDARYKRVGEREKGRVGARQDFPTTGGPRRDSSRHSSPPFPPSPPPPFAPSSLPREPSSWPFGTLTPKHSPASPAPTSSKSANRAWPWAMPSA